MAACGLQHPDTARANASATSTGEERRRKVHRCLGSVSGFRHSHDPNRYCVFQNAGTRYVCPVARSGEGIRGAVSKSPL